MIAYPAEFKREADGITVTFRDIPEAITCGFSESEAAECAVDAVETALSEYIKRRQEIPRASKVYGKNVRHVVLPALAEAKIRLYETMRRAGVRKADLARRLKWQKSQVDRLLDLTHQSRLDQVEQALAALDKTLAVQVLPRAAEMTAALSRLEAERADVEEAILKLESLRIARRRSNSASAAAAKKRVRTAPSKKRPATKRRRALRAERLS